MPTLVVSGAMLRCTMGSAPSPLQVDGGGPTAGGLPIATIANNKSGQNIQPFGNCDSDANLGASRKRPRPGVAPSFPQCMPVIVSPWIPGSPGVMAGNVPVVSSTCQCRCQWGGVISILNPGQPAVMAP